MGKEGRLRPLEPTEGLLHYSRIPPEGTVEQEKSSYEAPQKVKDTQKNPFTLTPTFLKQGREQFTVYCSPCHGISGYGNGMIVQRGFLAPPSYHSDRLRNAPDGHIFNVISKGIGSMYSYEDRISTSDRWAIIAYIRALQFSQNAKLNQLPVEDQRQIEKVTDR
jgi:mono/diheme cytochrome c family protein